MAFSIDGFKNKGLVFGGARPSLFSVFIPKFFGITSAGIEIDHAISEEVSFLGKATSIPPSIIDYIDIPYMGRKIRVNGDRTFPDWTVTIMNDENFTIRNALEDWHQAINSREGNRQRTVNGTGTSGRTLGKVSEYKRDLVVHQYGKTGSPAKAIASYTFLGAFPTSISPISLDWDTVNQIEQFDVTFSYDYWEPRE